MRRRKLLVGQVLIRLREHPDISKLIVLEFSRSFLANKKTKTPKRPPLARMMLRCRFVFSRPMHA